MNHEEMDRALENEVKKGADLLDQNIETLIDLKHTLKKFKLYRNSKKFNTTKFEDFDRYSIELAKSFAHAHTPTYILLLIFIHLCFSMPELSDIDVDEDDGENRQAHVKRLLERKGGKGQGSVHGATYTPDILSYCSSMDEDLDIGTDAPIISVDYKPTSYIFEQLSKLREREKAASSQ